MVHFPGLTRTRLCIQQAVIEVHSIGFPHSDIPGSKRICRSPRLIAACHVLRRLLAPRHPPYALSSLTIKLTQHVSVPQRTESPGCARRTLLQSFVVCSPVLRAKASSPFHNATRANLRFTPSIPRGVNLPAEQWRKLPASFSCQRTKLPLPISYSVGCGTSPRLAERDLGLEPKSRGNKKPGVERRVSPSIPDDNRRVTESREARLFATRYS